MKKTTFRTLCLLLSLVMLCSLFSACGSTGSAQEVSEPASTTEAAAPQVAAPQEEPAPTTDAFSSAVEAEIPKEEEPAANLTTYPLVDETETLTAYAPIRSENPAVVNVIEDWAAIQLAEEITNVHIDWDSIPESQYRELCPIMIASSDYADMIFSLNQGYDISKAYAEEVIVDLADYMQEYAPNYLSRLDNISRGYQQATTIDGSVLAFYSLNSGSNQQGALIRGDWLEEQNLDVPETLDEFVDMLYIFKDAYGVAPLQMSSATQEGELFTSAYDVPGYQVSIFGSGSYWYQVDNEVRCSLIEDGYREYLTLMNQLYNDTIFGRDFNSFSPGSNDATKSGLISSGIVGVLGVTDNMVDSSVDLISDIDGAYFVVAKNPVLNAGDMIHFGNQDEVSSGSTTASISVSCENIELAVQWLDFWYSEQGYMAFNYGIEGETYTLDANGTPVFTDIIENNEWGLGYTSAINTYCPIGNIPAYNDIRRFRQYYTDLTEEAIDLWGNATDLAYVLPKLSLTDEESDSYNANVADIETYAQECILSFITGAMDIDTEWDTYVSTLESMGVYENMEIYQAALDRMG